MPRKFLFTKEEIVDAAIRLTRKSGASALTARALGAELGSSTRPIFGLFKNMEEVRQEVICAANALYTGLTQETMKSGQYPLYKASGMAYIRFAKEEKELFKLLFMRDRTQETVAEDRESVRPLLQIIQQNLGLSEDEAYTFHLKMWIYVHGIATMLATSYLEWDEAFIGDVLTDAYVGLKHAYQTNTAHR